MEKKIEETDAKKKRSIKPQIIVKSLKNIIKTIFSISFFNNEEQSSYKLPKRCVFFSLFFIIFLSVTLKYPIEGLQGGTDSFTHHGLTNLILDHGNIPWSASIFSFFGLYPLSVSSGIHTLMASYSSISSMNLFYLITPFSFLQSVIAILGMFIATRQFKKDNRFALLSAIIYSGTTRFLYYTNQQIWTRGLFLTLLPFFLWALFRFLDNTDFKNFSFLALFAIICLAAHRMGMYILVIVLLLGIGILFHRLTVPIFWSRKKESNLINYIIIVSAFAILLFTYLFIDIPTIQMVMSRTPEIFLISRGFISYIIAFAYNYAKFMGIFSVFIPIGFLMITLKDKRNIKETALIITLILILFMAGGSLYLAPVLFGFFSLLSAYSLVYFRDMITRKRLIEFAIITMLIVGVLFPNMILYEDIDERYPFWLDDQTTEAGIYLARSEGYNGVGDYILSRRMDTFTSGTHGINLKRGYSSIEKFDFSTVEIKPLGNLVRNPQNPFTIEDWYWEHTARTWFIKDRIDSSNINNPQVEDWMYSHGVRYYTLDSIAEERAKRQSQDLTEREVGMSYSVVYNRYKYFSNDVVSVYWI